MAVGLPKGKGMCKYTSVIRAKRTGCLMYLLCYKYLKLPVFYFKRVVLSIANAGCAAAKLGAHMCGAINVLKIANTFCAGFVASERACKAKDCFIVRERTHMRMAVKGSEISAFACGVFKASAYIFAFALLLINGCAVHKNLPVIQYVNLTSKPEEVKELKLIRRNVDSGAFETVTLKSNEAKIERFGGKKTEPAVMEFEESEFKKLAQKAISISWNANPVRKRNPKLEEELFLITSTREEKVLFDENLPGELKGLYVELMKIRQDLLAKPKIDREQNR
ncbi:MAG: hypothetical protein ABII27_06300 [bacterium]